MELRILLAMTTGEKRLQYRNYELDKWQDVPVVIDHEYDKQKREWWDEIDNRTENDAKQWRE